MIHAFIVFTRLVLVLGSLALVAPAVRAASGGTDILHLFLHKAASPTELATNAAGRIELRQNRQGHADNQRLRVQLSGLETNAVHHLFGWLADDTNATYIGSVPSGSNGLARLDYWSVGSRHGFRPARAHLPVPDAINPVSRLRALALTDASTQAVLNADLTLPDKLQYLIKRRMTNDGVELPAQGTLRLHSTLAQGRVWVAATGLVATNDYLLAVNGVPVMTNTATRRGRLDFRGRLPVPAEVLDVRSVAVWNATSNSVLSATLP